MKMFTNCLQLQLPQQVERLLFLKAKKQKPSIEIPMFGFSSFSLFTAYQIMKRDTPQFEMCLFRIMYL